MYKIKLYILYRSLHELRTLWTKDGIPIENSRISYSFNDSWNRTLILISANITYNGMYSCHVDLRSGGYPTVNASAEVVVYGMINKSYFLYLPNINNFAYDIICYHY